MLCYNSILLLYTMVVPPYYVVISEINVQHTLASAYRFYELLINTQPLCLLLIPLLPLRESTLLFSGMK